MKLTARDERRIEGVHADLKRVTRSAWELFDGAEVLGMPGAKLTIPPDGGVRSVKRQAEIVKAGDSWTLQSRHLTGHAVDFAIIAGGVLVDSIDAYERVWLACWRPAAIQAQVPVIWGGRWKRRDGMHIELNRKEYAA